MRVKTQVVNGLSTLRKCSSLSTELSGLDIHREVEDYLSKLKTSEVLFCLHKQAY